MRNSDVFSVAGSGVLTIPAGISITGTISATGTAVTGVGTLFTTELLTRPDRDNILYPYLVLPSGEIGEVIKVISNTSLLIKTAFVGSVSGSAAKVMGITRGVARKIEVKNNAPGATNAGYSVFMPSMAVQTSKASIVKENENGLPPMSIVAGADALTVNVDYV